MQGERDAFTHQLQMLDEEVAMQESATAMEVFSVTVGAYMEGVRLKQEEIAVAIAEIDKKLEEQREKVAEGFRELKTFEIARDRELKERLREELRIEQEEFDELAMQSHVREEASLDSDTLDRRHS